MPAKDPARRRLQAQVAAAERHQTADREELRRALNERELHDYIVSIVDKAPPLTDEQRARLARVLFGNAA